MRIIMAATCTIKKSPTNPSTAIWSGWNATQIPHNIYYNKTMDYTDDSSKVARVKLHDFADLVVNYIVFYTF